MPGAQMSQQQNKTEIVISAVDRATATLNQIGARLEALTKPAVNITKALGKLYDSTGIGGVKKAVGGLKDSILGLGGAMVGIGGVYSGTVASIVMFANNAANAADKIGDLSSRYQISSETLQVYGSMIEEAGGSIEDAAAAMGKLKKNMQEAMHGGKEQAAAFAGIGISLEQLKKMSPEQVMEKMADAFKGSEKDLAKQAVLLELMGKNGTIFMDVMNQGAGAARDRYAEMRADGALLSEEQKKQADDYDKVWRRLGRTMEAIKNALGLKLANAMQSTVEAMQQWIVVNRGLIDQKFDAFLKKLPEIIQMGTDVITGLWGAVVIITDGFKELNKVLGPTGTTLLLLSGLISPVIVAAGTLTMAIGKVVWIFGSLAVKVFPMVMSGISGLWALIMAHPFVAIGAAIIALGVLIYKNWDTIVEYSTAAWNYVVNHVSKVWEKIVSCVSGAWDSLKSIFDVNFFDGIISGWMSTWQAFGDKIGGIIKSIMPESFIPDSLKNMKMSVITEQIQKFTGGPTSSANRPQGETTTAASAAASQSQRQDIKNTIKLEIDADGRPRVKEMRAGSSSTTIDVSAGLSMAGAF